MLTISVLRFVDVVVVDWGKPRASLAVHLATLFLISLVRASCSHCYHYADHNSRKYHYNIMCSRKDAQIYLRTFTVNNRPVRPLDG